jgi:hypothetical protein
LKLHISDLTLDVVSQKNTVVAKMSKGSLPFFLSWTKNAFEAKNLRALSRLEKCAFLIPDGEPFSYPLRKEIRVLPQYVEPRLGHIALRAV